MIIPDEGVLLERYATAEACEDLMEYANGMLRESFFFSFLRRDGICPYPAGTVLGQVYLWRSQFYRWVDTCLVKSRLDGAFPAAARLHNELNREFIAESRWGTGQNPCKPATPLPVTTRYCESFVRFYMFPERSGREATAALAGCNLAMGATGTLVNTVLPGRLSAGVGWQLLGLPEETAVGRFTALWRPLADPAAGPAALLDAARYEIWEHITFWDDVYMDAAGPQRVGPRRAPPADASHPLPATPPVRHSCQAEIGSPH